MRHKANLRIKLRGRPQTPQRLRARTLNLSDLCVFAIFALVATISSVVYFRIESKSVAQPLDGSANGMPSSLSMNRVCSSLLPEVTIVMFIPLEASTLLVSTSGKIMCSRTPRV